MKYSSASSIGSFPRREACPPRHSERLLRETSPDFRGAHSARLLLERAPLFKSIAVGSFALFSSLGFAQSIPAPPQRTQIAIQQLEALRTREQTTPPALPSKPEGSQVPELYPGESADLGTQMLLREKPIIRYFEFSADTQFSYTSNANLDRYFPKDTGVSASTLSLAFAPEAWDVGPGKLNFRAGYRHIFWVYDVQRLDSDGHLNDGNFELSSVFLSGRYTFWEHWSASLGIDHNRVLSGRLRPNEARGYDAPSWRWSRLFEPGNWGEVYTEFSPNWSLDRYFTISPKWSASLGYSGAYHFTHTDPYPTSRVNDRVDSNLMASVMFSPSASWMFQPYARVAHSLYTRSGRVDGLAGNNAHRRDLVRSIGLNAVWTLSDRTSVRASVSGEFRNSNDPNITDYGKFDAATGLTFTLRF